MHLFKTKQTQTEKITKFSAECLTCILDHGTINSFDKERLRGVSKKLRLSSKEIAESKIIMLKFFISALLKAGYSQEKAKDVGVLFLNQIITI